MEDEIVARLDSLQSEIGAIRERNQRVEGDKAWETSWQRRLFLLLATYLLTAIVFAAIGVEHCFRNALIPTLGYLLSTFTLPLLKHRYLQRSDSY